MKQVYKMQGSSMASQLLLSGEPILTVNSDKIDDESELPKLMKNKFVTIEVKRLSYGGKAAITIHLKDATRKLLVKI